MRVPLSGICTGFRIRQSGSVKDKSEYGYLDVLQLGDKKFDSTLTHVVIDDAELIQYFLTYYADGQLRKINLLVHQIPDGREKIWYLIKVFDLNDKLEVKEPPVITVEDDEHEQLDT